MQQSNQQENEPNRNIHNAASSFASFQNKAIEKGSLVMNRRNSDDGSTGSTRNAFAPATNITLHPLVRRLPPPNSIKDTGTRSKQARQDNKARVSSTPPLDNQNVPSGNNVEDKDSSDLSRPQPLSHKEYGVSVGEEEWYFQQQQNPTQPQVESSKDDDFIPPPPGLQEQRSSFLFGMPLIGEQGGLRPVTPPLRSVRPDPPGTRSSITSSQPGEMVAGNDGIDDVLSPIAVEKDHIAASLTPLTAASSPQNYAPPLSPPAKYHPVYRHYSKYHPVYSHYSVRDDSKRASNIVMELYGDVDYQNKPFLEKIWYALDPNNWLLWDLEQERRQRLGYNDNEGNEKKRRVHKKWSILRFIRFLLYNPLEPEFTSVQQFSWSTILGITMGVYTAVWKFIIEYCVETIWKTLPKTMVHMGIFTDLNGSFPLPHYMWICPSIFGGILSYIFARLSSDIPDQNDWIQTCHARGVIDHKSFWLLFILSTAGMASGLSLGPELPLVLTAGMIGSKLSVVTRQSVLSARAMNLTAASAAIAGFFGFPMAGALFVLELPHRMGLQYFEALSPATFASITAVIVNRMVLQNDVTGYYDYPFLNTVLPAHIFYIAIFYGIVGSAVGVIYTVGVKKMKSYVHSWFHCSNVDHHGDENEHMSHHDRAPADEEKALLFQGVSTSESLHKKGVFWGAHYEPVRATMAGTVAGFLTGLTCMFVPHVLFWGEAQLQTLIDNGKTPLPIFGRGDEVTADLTAYGFCLIDPSDDAAIAAGFSPACALVIALSKVFVIGLSLGTGIIGGHFWGPLFVGVATSYFVLSLCEALSGSYGIGVHLSAYPTVAVLCIMGSAHVVTFRAHMAIMLILTLTINAFNPEDGTGTEGYIAGDYSAVFPLLVVSCFISLMATRGVVFYKSQRSRGDIMAMPEALCEPGKAGQPIVVGYEDGEGSDCSDLHSEPRPPSPPELPSYQHFGSGRGVYDDGNSNVGQVSNSCTTASGKPSSVSPHHEKPTLHHQRIDSLSDYGTIPSPKNNASFNTKNKITHSRTESGESMTSIGSDCSGAFATSAGNNMAHNRTKSGESMTSNRSINSAGSNGRGNRPRANSATSNCSNSGFKRVNSYGEISDFQPSLFTQARLRSSSSNNVDAGGARGGSSQTSSSSLKESSNNFVTRGNKSQQGHTRTHSSSSTENRMD